MDFSCLGFRVPFPRHDLGFTPVAYIVDTLKVSVLENTLYPEYIILAVFIEHIQTKTELPASTYKTKESALAGNHEVLQLSRLV